MIHATPSALDKLEPLLLRLRSISQLKEKSRGIFYRKSRAFLHFHEDASGLFADVSVDSSWTRYAVNTTQETDLLFEVVKKEIDTNVKV